MSKQILMVDDSRTARMLCGAQLRQQRPDYVLLEAADGAEALQIAAETAPDFAIVDVNMPGMNGLELVERLRALFPALPICLLTANVQAQTRQRAEESGVFFFGKPLTKNIVGQMLSNMGA